MVRICIRMLRIPFEWFEFAFECFESLSKGSNLHSNASNPFRIVRICIRMLLITGMVRIWIRTLRIPFEWFEFAFEHFESLSIGLNLHWNASNPFRMFRICIRMLRIPFVRLEFAFERFESLLNVSNLHSNASNPV